MVYAKNQSLYDILSLVKLWYSLLLMLLDSSHTVAHYDGTLLINSAGGSSVILLIDWKCLSHYVAKSCFGMFYSSYWLSLLSYI